jgi:hypothetical protein
MPGQWVVVRFELNFDHVAQFDSVKKEAQSQLSSFLGESFSLVSMQLDKVMGKDDKGVPTKEFWIANISLMTHESVLKEHAEYLSKELGTKIYPTRIALSEWDFSDVEKQKFLVAKYVRKPKIVKWFSYIYKNEQKIAVFFYDEASCQTTQKPAQSGNQSEQNSSGVSQSESANEEKTLLDNRS